VHVAVHALRRWDGPRERVLQRVAAFLPRLRRVAFAMRVSMTIVMAGFFLPMAVRIAMAIIIASK
jgi:hypothetical protein